MDLKSSNSSRSIPDLYFCVTRRTEIPERIPNEETRIQMYFLISGLESRDCMLITRASQVGLVLHPLHLVQICSEQNFDEGLTLQGVLSTSSQ